MGQCWSYRQVSNTDILVKLSVYPLSSQLPDSEYITSIETNPSSSPITSVKLNSNLVPCLLLRIHFTNTCVSNHFQKVEIDTPQKM